MQRPGLTAYRDQRSAISASVMLEWWEIYKKRATESPAVEPKISKKKPKSQENPLKKGKPQPTAKTAAAAGTSSKPVSKDFIEVLEKILEPPTAENSVLGPMQSLSVQHDTHRFRPSSSKGQRVQGLVEWSIYDRDTAQVLLSECLKSEFVLEDKTLHLCREINIRGLDGDVRLKFIVPEQEFEIEGKLEDGEIEHPDYKVIMAYDLVRARPRELQYWHGDELLTAMPGTQCPFGGKNIPNMRELLRYHASRHPNLLFSVHPLLENAIEVGEIPGARSEAHTEVASGLREGDEELQAVLGRRIWVG